MPAITKVWERYDCAAIAEMLLVQTETVNGSVETPVKSSRQPGPERGSPMERSGQVTRNRVGRMS